jgi:hypothetical protein
MAWTFEVDVELLAKNFTTKLMLSILGLKTDTPITLGFRTGASKKAVIKGGIEYKCQESKFLPDNANCSCVMYDLKRDPPAEESSISPKLLEELPVAAKLPHVDYSIKQPIVKITPDMQVIGTNEGKCYNVLIDVKAEFIPGQVQAKTKVKLPSPLSEIELEAVAEVGESALVRLQAEYRLCCCEWNDNLPKYDPEKHPDLKKDELGVNRDNCKCGEYIRCLWGKVTGNANVIGMSIKAAEQSCPFTNRMANIEVKVPGKADEITRPPFPST